MSQTDESSTTFPFANFVSQWAGQGTERLEALVDQWEKWEERSADQAERAVEETAHLMRASFDYSLELQREFRQQAIENTRKTLAMMAGDRGDDQ